jgi:hypothetical protein
MGNFRSQDVLETPAVMCIVRIPMSKKQAKTPPSPRFQSVPSWCERTGLSDTTTRHAIATGVLRAVFDGRVLKVDVQDGERFINSMPHAFEPYLGEAEVVQFLRSRAPPGRPRRLRPVNPADGDPPKAA